MSKLDVVSNREIKRGYCLAVKADGEVFGVIYDGKIGGADFETLKKATTVHLHPEDIYDLKDFLRKKRSN